VHVSCLNRWRSMSTNPRSYHECDACGFRYNIRRTALARACTDYMVQEVMTGVVLAVLVCAGGAASCWTGAEHALYRTCEWAPPWTHATMGGRAADLVVCGLIVVGAAGAAMAAWRAYAQDGAGTLAWNLGMLFAAHGAMATRVLVLVGLLFALKTVRDDVRSRVTYLLARFGDYILSYGTT